MYPVWNAMIARCTKPHHKSWVNYGGRGITVCDEWMPPKEIGFVNFLRDMVDTHPDLFNGDPYLPDYFHAGKSLDRRFDMLGYSKENCRWVSDRVQMVNRRAAVANRILPQGVCWREAKGKFQSYYTEGKKYKSLGMYCWLLDAVAVRKSWEIGRFKLLDAESHAGTWSVED